MRNIHGPSFFLLFTLFVMISAFFCAVYWKPFCEAFESDDAWKKSFLDHPAKSPQELIEETQRELKQLHLLKSATIVDTSRGILDETEKSIQDIQSRLVEEAGRGIRDEAQKSIRQEAEKQLSALREKRRQLQREVEENAAQKLREAREQTLSLQEEKRQKEAAETQVQILQRRLEDMKKKEEKVQVGVPFSTNGRCGPNHGNTRCKGGACCSRFGWCGAGSAWCDKYPIKDKKYHGPDSKFHTANSHSNKKEKIATFYKHSNYKGKSLTVYKEPGKTFRNNKMIADVSSDDLKKAGLYKEISSVRFHTPCEIRFWYSVANTSLRAFFKADKSFSWINSVQANTNDAVLYVDIYEK